MRSGLDSYAIDDQESAEANFQAFVDQLKATDAKLSDVLAPYLLLFSQGTVPDSAAILDALFAATAAPEPSESEAGRGAA